MSVYCTLFSQTFYGLLFCYLTITDVHVTLYLQIIDFQFPLAVHRNPPKTLTKSLLWTVLWILLDPITKKITLARFACLCFIHNLCTDRKAITITNHENTCFHIFFLFCCFTFWSQDYSQYNIVSLYSIVNQMITTCIK